MSFNDNNKKLLSFRLQSHTSSIPSSVPTAISYKCLSPVGTTYLAHRIPLHWNILVIGVKEQNIRIASIFNFPHRPVYIMCSQMFLRHCERAHSTATQYFLQLSDPVTPNTRFTHMKHAKRHNPVLPNISGCHLKSFDSVSTVPINEADWWRSTDKLLP